MFRACINLILVTVIAVVQVAACSPSVLLDGADQPPPPPTRKVRRDLEQEIRELQQELDTTKQQLERALNASADGLEEETLPVEAAVTWEEVASLLPTDYTGEIDWMLALTSGAIAPRPGLRSDAAEQAVFDFDVRFADSPSSANHVTYRHASHTQVLSCDNCHPAIFPLERGAEPPTITMADINAGKYCGACHGTVAFAVDNACARCHQETTVLADWQPSEAPRTPIEAVGTWDEAVQLLPVTMDLPDWAAALREGVIDPRAGVDPDTPHQPVLPFDVELIPEAMPAFKAVFSHEPHTAVLTCANCHPGIFTMRAGSNDISMEKIYAGEYCGACHGKVAFDVNTGCGRCHAALAPSQ